MRALSSSIQLGSLRVRNRNWMGALTRNRCLPKDVPSDLNAEYYAQRAKGGAGLIVSEAALIRRQGCLHSNVPGLWTDEHAAGWRKVNDAVHARGGVMFAQLWHMGRVAHPDMPEHKASGIPVYAPSAISARGGRFRELPGEPGYVTPTAIEDPMSIIKEYRHSAEQAKKAGFDGVELHGANGYLVHQFLDSTSNTRTDQWGGSVQNRIRFPILVLQELIQVFSADRIGIKLTPGGGFNDMGMPLQETLDTFSAIITEAVKLKIGFITLVRISPGMPFLKPEQPNPGTYHDVLTSYGSLIKKRGSSTLLVLNQDLTAEEGNALIEQEKIDVAMYGRHWINNPDFQRRIEQGVALNRHMDVKSWYNVSEHPSKGYLDYPTATY